VPALLNLVVMDKFGIRPLCPTPQRLIELFRKRAYGNRDGDVFEAEKGELALPMSTA
jgi:hypothetical protein